MEFEWISEWISRGFQMDLGMDSGMDFAWIPKTNRLVVSMETEMNFGWILNDFFVGCKLCNLSNEIGPKNPSEIHAEFISVFSTVPGWGPDNSPGTPAGEGAGSHNRCGRPCHWLVPNATGRTDRQDPTPPRDFPM